MFKVRKFVWFAVMMCTFSLTTWAGVHPVPLDPKQSPSTCIECHDDKTKGKSVHTAIAMGCDSCHEVRLNNDVTRVKLKATTVQSLCITCHADKEASKLKGKVHSPAVRDCIDCHSPHATDNKNQLLKPAEGDRKDSNLCLACHNIGLDVPKEGSRHAALDMGCSACHVTHKTGERGKEEFDYHLTKSSPALCIDCHDANDAGLKKKHSGQPFGTTNCIQCHDPHQSNQPHLMQKFTHAPFSGGQCDTCHQPAKDNKVVLTSATAKEVCITCHSDKPTQIEKAKVHHPGADGECTDCHNPHAGKSQGFPKPDAVNICLGCHSDQAEQHKKTHLHQPAFEQGCATCHEPHGGDNSKLLRATGNALCIECHGPTIKAVTLEKEHIVTIFDGKVKLPEDYFEKVIRLPIRYGAGHPIDRHPVVDLMDPSDKNKVRASIGCMSCHQPHASSQPGLLVKDQVNNMAFCDGCHKDRTMRTVAGDK